METEEIKNQDSSTTTHQIFKDETTHAKVMKHLADENDEITAQDISNIKTEMSIATEEDFEKEAKREGFSKEEIDVIKNARN